MLFVFSLSLRVCLPPSRTTLLTIKSRTSVLCSHHLLPFLLRLPDLYVCSKKLPNSPIHFCQSPLESIPTTCISPIFFFTQSSLSDASNIYLHLQSQSHQTSNLSQTAPSSTTTHTTFFQDACCPFGHSEPLPGYGLALHHRYRTQGRHSHVCCINRPMRK